MKVSYFVLGMICFFGIQLQSMKPTSKFTIKQSRMLQPVQRKKPMMYKTEMVWIKTSDNRIIEMPLWYVDQMKVLQVLLVHQKGKNSKNNPLNASMVTSEQLTLLQMALKNAVDPAKLELFCDNLTQNEKTNLINSSFILEALGLAALLAHVLYAPELGVAVNAVGILDPVMSYLQRVTHEKMIFDNNNFVSCVLFSHEGNFVISGASGKQNNLIIWDSTSGKKQKNLVGHPLWVQCIAISPDDAFIVSGGSSKENNFILWNISGGSKTLIGHNGWVTCVAFSKNGDYIISGSEGIHNNLILWDGKTGEQIKIFEGHTKSVKCAAFSPDGNFIISGSDSDENNLILWNIITGEKNFLEGHEGKVTCAVFSKNGDYIISGSEGEQNNLILWNGKTGELIKKLDGHSKYVTCASFSPDNNYIISGSYENEHNLILWNVKTRKQIKILEGHEGGVNCALFSPDGSCIASGSYGEHKNLIVWDGTTGRLLKICEGHTKNVRSISFHPKSNALVSGAFCHRPNLIEWSLLHTRVLNFIAIQLNIAQARLLYRLYLGKINNVLVVLEKNDPDYQTYLILPYNVQRLIMTHLPFELVDAFEKAVEKKINDFKINFAKLHAAYDEKVKTLKAIMKDFDKNSIDYQASERFLIELEQEKAFEGM